MTVMMTVGVESYPSLDIIDQKFLLPGHTHLECDVDHAQIAKKHNTFEIMIPRDWYNFGKVAFIAREISNESH
jgi:hypothetical protein